jgi:hypothetical protein
VFGTPFLGKRILTRFWATGRREAVLSIAKPDKFERIFHEANPERTLKGTVPDSGLIGILLLGLHKSVPWIDKTSVTSLIN